MKRDRRAATVRAEGEARVYVISPRFFGFMVRSSRAFSERVSKLAEERKRELARI